MARIDYLNALRDELKNKLTKEECDNIIEYYEEYFEDAGIENEAAIINELGTPKEFAKKFIEGDVPFDYIENAEEALPVIEEVKTETTDTDEKDKNNNWIIILVIAICTAPLWISALGGAVGSVITIFSLNLSFFVAAAALMISGIVCIPVGIGIMFKSLGTGLLTMGIGFIALAIGIAFLLLAVAMLNLIIKIIKWIISKIKKEA